MTTKEAVLLYLQEHAGEPISGEKMTNFNLESYPIIKKRRLCHRFFYE